MFRFFRSSILKRAIRTASVKFGKPHGVFLMCTAQLSFNKVNFDENVHNIDLALQQACSVGESAIAELMGMFKTNVLEIAERYKECLQKEIEIIIEASAAGHFSESWDKLPEYRSLAHQLNEDLDKILVAIRTMRTLADNTELFYITQQESYSKLISSKCSEIEILISNQREEIKNLEKIILKLQHDFILNSE